MSCVVGCFLVCVRVWLRVRLHGRVARCLRSFVIFVVCLLARLCAWLIERWLFGRRCLFGRCRCCSFA